MKSAWQKLHKIGDILHLPNLPNWLIGIIALVLILRIPSFFEPYYYGDEMVYMTLGQGIRQGLTLYKDIHDNKPPLIYIGAAIAGNLFWFKVILAAWNIITIVFFYKLAKSLFEGRDKVQKISTLLFALLTTLPLLEGLTVNSELFMIGFTIAALLILLGKNLNSKKIFLAGVLFGMGALFKIPAAFDVPVIVFYWIITKNLKGDWKEILKNTVILSVGFAVPILLTFIWYFFKGALPEYLTAAFLQNVGYLSSFRPSDVHKSFFVRNAPLLIRGLVVLIVSAVLFIFRKKLSSKFVLLSLWTVFALFAITLSERPYPHYFIQAIAPISLLLGMLLTEKTFEQVLTLFPLTLAFIVPVYYKFYFYSTSSYYVRFVNFATHRINKEIYFNSFAPTVNRNYAIANFLVMSSTTKDRVFMWDPDSAAVYALARRLPPIKYVVPYHVMDFSSLPNVAGQISANPPRFIILTSGNSFPDLTKLIKQKYIRIQTIENADIYSRIDLVQAR